MTLCIMNGSITFPYLIIEKIVLYCDTEKEVINFRLTCKTIYNFVTKNDMKKYKENKIIRDNIEVDRKAGVPKGGYKTDYDFIYNRLPDDYNIFTYNEAGNIIGIDKKPPFPNMRIHVFVEILVNVLKLEFRRTTEGCSQRILRSQFNVE